MTTAVGVADTVADTVVATVGLGGADVVAAHDVADSWDGLGFYLEPVTPASRQRLIEASVALLVPRFTHHRVRTADAAGFNRELMGRFFDWLEPHPGQTWQHRWFSGGGDAAGRGWVAGASEKERNGLHRGIEATVCLGAIRPSYDWLAVLYGRRLWSTWTEVNDAALFTRFTAAGRAAGLREHRLADMVKTLVRVCVRTGKSLAALTPPDLLGYRRHLLESPARSYGKAMHATYHLGRSVGLFEDGPADLGQLIVTGQLSPAQLVARYGVGSERIGGLLTDYLTERAASLDYSALRGLAYILVKVFWRDLERHHCGIDSHQLSHEQAQGWKQRARRTERGDERVDWLGVLATVRSFYLDLSQWAHEDPARWVQWAVPCPIGDTEIRQLGRGRHQRTARMNNRTRSLAPLLPTLVASSRRYRETTAQQLTAANAGAIGDRFTVTGRDYQRIERNSQRGGALRIVDVETNELIDPVHAEWDGFWAWAIIETLRLTGARIEELLELTHLSIRQYQTADGEIMPLLQISPSKTDRERVLPVEPELAHVLAQIVRRATGPHNTIAPVSRRDHHELTWTAPLPYLFQVRTSGRPRVISASGVAEILARAVTRAGLIDNDLNPVSWTPHDFRRLFATETVNGGLPIHIAATLLGHLDLNTTRGYTAIYPEEVFRAYQQFIDRRRATRPADEYREPTTEDLDGLAEHFTARRNELGRCDRPYATPCIHEHACTRCPFQRVDPNALPRLLQIEKSVHERITEAEDNRWLADVTQLRQTLHHIEGKKTQVRRLLDNPPTPLLIAAPPTV